MLLIGDLRVVQLIFHWDLCIIRYVFCVKGCEWVVHERICFLFFLEICKMKKKTMMTRVVTLMLIALMAVSAANAGTVIWSDDFEAYDIETSADFSVGGVATGNWTGTPLAGSRTFHTSNFGGSDLWISNTDGTSIISAGIAVDSVTEYAFSVNLVAETNRAGRGVDGSYDLLVGTDAGSAISIIGGPVTVIAVGDDEVTGDSYADQIFKEVFTTGTIGAGEQLFINIILTHCI